MICVQPGRLGKTIANPKQFIVVLNEAKDASVDALHAHIELRC